MSKYQVTLTKTLDWTVEVEANDPTEAVEIAVNSKEAGSRLCHQCSRQANDGEWDAAEEDVELIGESDD